MENNKKLFLVSLEGEKIEITLKIPQHSNYIKNVIETSPDYIEVILNKIRSCILKK